MDKINMHEDHEASCFCCDFLKDEPSARYSEWSEHGYSIECKHKDIGMYFGEPDADDLHKFTRARTCPFFEERRKVQSPHEDAGNIKFTKKDRKREMHICDNEGNWLKVAEMTDC